MNKSELVAAVAAITGLKKNETEETINATIKAIGQALKERKKVQLIGFGSFDVKHRPARTGRNPRDGSPLQIAASDTVRFSPGKTLVDGL